MTMDVAACLDPEIAAALAASPIGSLDFGTFTFETVPQIREAMENMPVVELPPTTTVSREVVVPGVDGPDVTVRVVLAPSEASGRPCIYWIHGGGYLFGSGLTVDARINRWVEELDCVAVSIEYRLAPRTRTRRRSTTATRVCCGPRATPTSSASTPPASRSWARAPAVDSRPGLRSARATGARSRRRSSC